MKIQHFSKIFSKKALTMYILRGIMAIAVTTVGCCNLLTFTFYRRTEIIVSRKDVSYVAVRNE